MKMLNYCLLSAICLALLGSKCAPTGGGPTGDGQSPSAAPPAQQREGIDLERVETNWSKLALEAKASGQWDNQQKKWKNATFEGKLPAYVPVFADCGSVNLGGINSDQILTEIRALAAAAAAPNAKVALVGEPGDDVDARVQALAWQIAKRCSSAAALHDREIVSIDLSTIKDDVLARKLSDIQYFGYVKQIFEQIMRKHGQGAIYYLNEFPVLASTNVNPESILRIFLDANVNVIIEATPAEFNQHLSSLKAITLQPLPSDLVLPAASALAADVPEDLVEDIVRLTRGFLPERGVLQNVARALSRLGSPSRDNAIAAVASLDGRLQREALAKSNALNRTTTLTELDANVALSRRYYLDQQKKDDLVQGTKQAMEPVIAAITAKLSEVEKRITESLTEQVRALQSNIDKLGAKLDTTSLELATKLLFHTETITNELAVIVNGQDASKAELLAKIAESQDALLARFNTKLGKLSDAQQHMFEQLSTSHEQIASAVTNLQKGSNEQMTKIGDIIAQQLLLEKNLNEKTAALSGALSKTNSDLATVVLRLETLSTEQKTLFDTVNDIQGTLTKTILPKIGELSEAQKKALEQITTGLDTMSRSIESTEQKVMTKIADNYQTLLVIIENNKNALVADAAEKVAQLNTTFAAEIARLDEQGTKQKNEINARIDGAVSSLTEALKTAKTDLAKPIGDLSVTLNELTTKVMALDEKASASEKTLLAEIASATQKISEALKEVSDANKKEMLVAITALSREHRDLVKELNDLGSEVLSQKSEGLKEITANIADTAAALVSGKPEDLAKVKNLRLAFKTMTTRLGSVELHLMQLQKDLVEKAHALDTQIDKVSAKLDSVSRELAEEVKRNTLAISNKLEGIVKRQELDKTEMLEKIVNAQEALLKDFTTRLGTLTLAQEEKFKEISKAHDKLADAIAKADKSSTEKIAQIAAHQLTFEKALNAATERFAADISKTNGELASAVEHLNKLSTDQTKLFDTISAVQKEITDTVLPKIGELSVAQKDALDKITNGLTTLSGKIDSSEQKVLNQLASNYKDLLAVIETAKNSAFADAAGKVASLNKALSEKIEGVDGRISGAVISLTQAIKDAASSNNAEFGKSTGDLSGTLEGLTRKIASLDEKTTSSEKALLDKIAISVKNATDQLSQAISSGKREGLAEVNKANLAIADLASRLERVETNVADLQSKLEANLKETRETINGLESKIEKSLHAEIARANQELSDGLHKAMASGDQKVMDAVNLATVTHKDLVRTVNELSAKALSNKLEILENLERKVKESTDALKIAIATGREEDIAKVDKLQNDVGALSNRLNRVESEVEKLKIELRNGLREANAAIEAAKNKVGPSVTTTELIGIDELKKTVAGLQTQVDALGQTVSQQKTDLLAELAKRCAELAGTWESSVKEKSEAAVKPLIETINTLEQKTKELGNDLTGAKQDAGFKIEALVKDHAELKSQIEELIRSRDADGLKTAEAIANAQKVLADRVDALEKQGPEYDAIWKELRLANKKLRDELDASIQAAKDGATEAHKAALAQIKDLAEKGSTLAQNLANTDAKIPTLKAELDNLKEEFINVYKFLFRQPGMLQASEQKHGRKVEILPNCLKSTLDEARNRNKDPNRLIVECGINCLVVDKQFGFKKGETGDRSEGGFFEFDLDVGLTSDIPKVRCIPRAIGSEHAGLPPEEPIKVSGAKAVAQPGAAAQRGYVALTLFSGETGVNDTQFREYEKFHDEGLFHAIAQLMVKNKDLHYPLAIVRRDATILSLDYGYFVLSLEGLTAKMGKTEVQIGKSYSDGSYTYKVVRILESEPRPDTARIAVDCEKESAWHFNGVRGLARCSEEDDEHVDTHLTSCFYISRWEAEKLPNYETVHPNDGHLLWQGSDYGFSFSEGEKKIYCGYGTHTWFRGPLPPTPPITRPYNADPHVALEDLAGNPIVNDERFEALAKSHDEGLVRAIDQLIGKHKSNYPLAVVHYEYFNRTEKFYVIPLKFLKNIIKENRRNANTKIAIDGVYYDHNEREKYRIMRVFQSAPHSDVSAIAFDCDNYNEPKMKGIKGQTRCSKERSESNTKCFYLSRWEAKRLNGFNRDVLDERYRPAHTYSFSYVDEDNQKLYCTIHIDPWAGPPL